MLLDIGSISPGGEIGKHSGLRSRKLRVRVSPRAPPNPSVGKSGLIRLVWDEETEGSNPSTRTKFIF